MTTVTERAALAAESILGNERLTNNLDDDAAKVLLDWGLAYVETIAAQTEGLDDEQAEEMMAPRLKALRSLMKLVNKWVPRRAKLDATASETKLEEVTALVQLIQASAFEAPRPYRHQQFLNNVQSYNAPTMITELRELFVPPPPVQREVPAALRSLSDAFEALEPPPNEESGDIAEPPPTPPTTNKKASEEANHTTSESITSSPTEAPQSTPEGAESAEEVYQGKWSAREQKEAITSPQTGSRREAGDDHESEAIESSHWSDTLNRSPLFFPVRFIFRWWRERK